MRWNWGKIITAIGFVALTIGAIDPMEGSLLILPGSGLIALGAYLEKAEPDRFRFRLWMFLLILFGVGSLFIISWMGGIGGESQPSLWWGVLFLPYLMGWSLSIWAKDSPKWVIWGGMLVCLWYFAILYMALSGWFPNRSLEMLLAPIILSALGLLTLIGCIWRLNHQKLA